MGASQPNTLSGKLNVQSFTLPAGQTRIVTGPLTIDAKASIVIDGRLLVQNGMRFTLSARSFRLGKHGSIAPAPPGARTPALSALEPIGPGVDGILGKSSLDIFGELKTGPGTTLKQATGEDGAIGIVDGRITAGDGLPSPTKFADGQDGGSIIIGGYFGSNAAVEIDHGSVLEAGNGGHGYDDETGELRNGANPCQDSNRGEAASRQTLLLEGTDGGKGGTIRLLSRHLVIEGRAHAGDGGRGGNAGRVGLRAPDGVAGHGGADIDARPGRGGDGGSIDLRPPGQVGPSTQVAAQLVAGAGGNAGWVIAAAGNGAPNCDGGRTTAALDRPGKNGTAVEQLKSQPYDGRVLLQFGANGGDAADQGHAAGDGGRVTVSVPRVKGTPSTPGRHLVDEIFVAGYANGGKGYSDCREQPYTRGTEGGTGGSLLMPRVESTVDRSFDGRDGGAGKHARRRFQTLGFGGGRSRASHVDWNP